MIATSVSVSSSSFVKPYFIEELGCEGLTSREIAHSLGMDHSQMMRIFRNLQDSQELRHSVEGCVITENNQKIGIFYVCTDDAKLVAARAPCKSGIGYCRYLIECEKVVIKLASEPVLILPSTYLEALKALVASEEEKEAIQEELKVANKVVEDLCGCHHLMSLTDALKHIGIKSKLGIKGLREHGALTLNNMPTSYQMKTKHFEIKSRLCDTVYREQCMVTGEGLVWLKGLKWPDSLREAA